MAVEDTSEVAADSPQSTESMLTELLAAQKEHRAEVQQLRDELAASKVPAPQVNVQALNAEELATKRAAEIAAYPFYCPGCGRLYDYQRQCTGSGEAPHPAIEVVATDELTSGDPTTHTPAPIPPVG